MWAEVLREFYWIQLILAVAGGLVTGSFLNVVIWRYPIIIRQEMAGVNLSEEASASSLPCTGLALPRSHCPRCLNTIRWKDNIPLLSWILLKGRCRDCNETISWRYPFVEVLTAAAFLASAVTWPDSGWSLAVMVLSAWLIVASILDIDTRWLPDVFTHGVLWSGLITAWLEESPLSLHDATSGVLAGFTAFYILRWIAGTVLQKEALGMGDVLLFAGIGGWVGVLSLPTVALLASSAGLVYAIITRKLSGALPFGPCISFGTIATLYGQAII